jgi:hypothetical protein
MSSLGFLRGRVDRPQRPSPGSQHRELRRAHLPQVLVTRTPTSRQRAGTRRLGSGDAVLIPILVALPQAKFSGMGSHVIAAQRAAQKSGGTRWPGSWQCPGFGATSVAEG